MIRDYIHSDYSKLSAYRKQYVEEAYDSMKKTGRKVDRQPSTDTDIV